MESRKFRFLLTCSAEIFCNSILLDYIYFLKLRQLLWCLNLILLLKEVCNVNTVDSTLIIIYTHTIYSWGRASSFIIWFHGERGCATQRNLAGKWGKACCIHGKRSIEISLYTDNGVVAWTNLLRCLCCFGFSSLPLYFQCLHVCSFLLSFLSFLDSDRTRILKIFNLIKKTTGVNFIYLFIDFRSLAEWLH